MNAASVYHMAGSWSQSLDISVDSDLDISQFCIMTLIHWISLRYFIQIKSSAFQSSVSTPFCSNLSTANLHLYHFSFIASVHFKLTLSLSCGWSISPNSASHPETKPCILSCPQLSQKWLTPGFSLANVQNGFFNAFFWYVCVSPPMSCASLWLKNLLGFYWKKNFQEYRSFFCYLFLPS